jgi:hypothetical protein
MKIIRINKKHIPYIFFALVLFIAIAISISNSDLFKRKPPSEPIEPTKRKVDKIKKNIEKLELDILNSNNQKFTAIKDTIFTKIESTTNNANQNITQYIDGVISVKETAFIIYLLAYDKIKKTDKCNVVIRNKFDDYFIIQISDLQKEIGLDILSFEQFLNKNTVELSTDYSLQLENLNDSTLNLNSSFKDYCETSLNIESDMKQFQINVFLTNLGFVTEAIFYKQLFNAFRNVLGKLSLKVSAKATTGTGFALIDGPLPIGDIIALGSFLWTIKDIYDIHIVLKNELKGQLQESIKKYNIDIKIEVKNRMEEILSRYNEINLSQKEKALNLLEDIK